MKWIIGLSLFGAGTFGLSGCADAGSIEKRHPAAVDPAPAKARGVEGILPTASRAPEGVDPEPGLPLEAGKAPRMLFSREDFIPLPETKRVN